MPLARKRSPARSSANKSIRSWSDRSTAASRSTIPRCLASLTAYRLLATSSLIDAGRDLASLPLAIALGLTDPGPRDFFGGTIPVGSALDIGAHEAFAPGDYNGNGTVDAADYTVWRDTIGSTSDLRADGNGDRMIDEDDYNMWKSLFGTTYDSGAGSGSAVPEPTSELASWSWTRLMPSHGESAPALRITHRGATSCV